MKILTTLIAFMLSSLVVQGAGLVWPTETKGIFVKKFGPPIETVESPDGFTVTPADVSAMFAPGKFTIMIHADDTHYVVTRYSRKQTLKQAQLFGAMINGKTGAVEKPGLGLKVLKTYDMLKLLESSSQTLSPKADRSSKSEISYRYESPEKEGEPIKTDDEIKHAKTIWEHDEAMKLTNQYLKEGK